MEKRRLGRSGIEVAVLGLGTAALGADYGVGSPGRPDEASALRVVAAALDAGVDFFDTAPAYGDAERLLGRALRGRGVVVATKVPARGDVRASVEASLRALRREALDVVQIHNATVELVERGDVAAELEALRAEGKVRALGASVYTEAEALAVVESGCFDVLQVAYNVLDRRMEPRALPAAEDADVGVVLRSALLQGVLTAKSERLPASLAPVARAADEARAAVGGSWPRLARAAVRFCLGRLAAGCVLVGARTEREVAEAVAAAAEGPLDAAAAAALEPFALSDPALVDPSRWPAA